jgi:hypothetical protein
MIFIVFFAVCTLLGHRHNSLDRQIDIIVFLIYLRDGRAEILARFSLSLSYVFIHIYESLILELKICSHLIDPAANGSLVNLMPPVERSIVVAR